MIISDNKNVAHPKKQVLYKFLLLSILLTSYFSYLSFKYDLVTGGIASALTWTFFVLCTPIADAGFLLDFPLRILFGIRMLISEIVVWVIAIAVNIISLIYFSNYYETTELTMLLHTLLTTPFPYWGVVLLSGAGTFLSIRFADELMDVVHHRDREFFHRHGFKYEIVLIIFFIFVIFGYYKLIASLGINTSF